MHSRISARVPASASPSFADWLIEYAHVQPRSIVYIGCKRAAFDPKGIWASTEELLYVMFPILAP